MSDDLDWLSNKLDNITDAEKSAFLSKIDLVLENPVFTEEDARKIAFERLLATRTK